MPKVVVKSKYLTSKAHMTEYLKYIATREGVELLPEPVRNRAATEAQQNFIEHHLKDMEGRAEYAYYLASPTLDNASHLITAYSESGLDRQQEFEKLARGKSALVSKDGLDNPATKNQKKWIEAHIGGMRDLLEYEDYIKNPTFGNASELITTIAEYNTTDPEIYLKYIAERPGVYRHKGEAHGLWNMAGKADLKSELKKIKDMDSVAWVHIVSLRRDDAKNLDFENADAWRKIVASNADKIAKLYNIDIKNLNLLGAFHNEGRHPHVHLFMYSTAGGKEGIIPKNQMKHAGEKMRSMFTNSIFKQNIEPLIGRRNEIRKELAERVEAVSQLFRNDYEPGSSVQFSLLDLSKTLPDKGKLQYAFMTPQVKEKVNDALRQIVGGDEILNDLTEEYFALQHTLIEQYNDDPEKVDAKYSDFVERFYEPRSGKFSDGRDITTLHNIILKSAAMLKDNAGVQEKSKLESADEAKEGRQETEIDADNIFSSPTFSNNGSDESSPSFSNNGSDENNSITNNTPQDNNYFIRYAAVSAVRMIGEELAALCDTVETCSKPRKPEKARRRSRFKENKKLKRREEIDR